MRQYRLNKRLRDAELKRRQHAESTSLGTNYYHITEHRYYHITEHRRNYRLYNLHMHVELEVYLAAQILECMKSIRTTKDSMNYALVENEANYKRKKTGTSFSVL